MVMKSVIIRDKEHFSSMNKVLKDAIKNSMRKTIPLVYQYLHNPDIEFYVDDDNKLGEVSNLRFDNKGNLIGDILLYDMLHLAIHYQGGVDNIFASINQKTKKPEVYGFVIYDKFAKSVIDDKNKNKSNNDTFEIRPGNVPIVSNIDNVKLQEVCEEIIEEYKKLTSSEQMTNKDERGE